MKDLIHERASEVYKFATNLRKESLALQRLSTQLEEKWGKFLDFLPGRDLK